MFTCCFGGRAAESVGAPCEISVKPGSNHRFRKSLSLNNNRQYADTIDVFEKALLPRDSTVFEDVESFDGHNGCVSANQLIQRGVPVLSSTSQPGGGLSSNYAVLRLDVGCPDWLNAPDPHESPSVLEAARSRLAVHRSASASALTPPPSLNAARSRSTFICNDATSPTPNGGVETLNPDIVSQPCRHQLSPVFVSRAATHRFHLGHGPHAYASVLRKLVQRDPLLSFALQRALKYLAAAEVRSVHHIMSDCGAVDPAALYAIRLSACVWQDDIGRQVPALLVEHDLPYNPQELVPKLMRDYAILAQVPHVLTLIDMQCKVLYQNAASLIYMGDVSSMHSSDIHTGSTGLLDLLFCHEPSNLKALLQTVQQGNQWRQRVKVPASLKRLVVRKRRQYLTSAPPAAPAQAAAPAGGSASSAATARDMPHPHAVASAPSFTPAGPAPALRYTHSLGGHEPRSLTRNPISSDSIARFADEDDLQFCINSFSTQQPAFSIHPSSTAQPGRLCWQSSRLEPATGGSGNVGPGALASRAAGTLPAVLGSSTRGGEDSGSGNPRRLLHLMDSAHKRDSTPPRVDSGAGLSRQDMGGLSGGDSRHGSSHSLRDLHAGSQRSAPDVPGRLTLSPSEGAASQRCESEREPSNTALFADAASPSMLSGTEVETCWHEVQAIPLLDPVLDKQVILLVQTDITPTVELENRLGDLTDAQFMMLDQLFPRHVIEFMLCNTPSQASRNLGQLASYHPQVVVLFADVVGFTAMSEKVDAHEVLIFINQLYTLFDGLVDDYGLYKLDTSGDCYIVAAGIIQVDEDGFSCVQDAERVGDRVGERAMQQAAAMMDFAKQLLRCANKVLMPHNHQPVQLRIGLHSGPLVSGLVGLKMPKFTAFGSTMNTASRMESTCVPGCIQASAVTAKMLRSEAWTSTGGVDVKGIGCMETFLWTPRPADLADSGDQEEAFERRASQGVLLNAFARAPSTSAATPTCSATLPGDAALASYGSADAQLSQPLARLSAGGPHLDNVDVSSASNFPSGGPSWCPADSSRALGVGAQSGAHALLGSGGRPPSASYRVHRSGNFSQVSVDNSEVGQLLMKIISNLRSSSK